MLLFYVFMQELTAWIWHLSAVNTDDSYRSLATLLKEIELRSDATRHPIRVYGLKNKYKKYIYIKE
jgi:hypothetical protein